MMRGRLLCSQRDGRPADNQLSSHLGKAPGTRIGCGAQFARLKALMEGSMAAVEGWQLPRRSLPLKVFSGTLTGLRQIIMLGILLLFVAPLALNYFENPRKYVATSYLFDGRDYIMRNVGPEVRKYVPTRVSGADRTDWVIVAGLLVVAMAAGSVRRRAETRALRRGMRKNVENWKQRMGLAENSEVARELENKISGLQNSGNLNRQELLKLFAETKRKLDSMGREV